MSTDEQILTVLTELKVGMGQLTAEVQQLRRNDDDVKTRVTDVETKANGRIDKVHERVEKVEIRVGTLETTSAGDRVRWSTVSAVGAGALASGTAIGAALMRMFGG